jgi:hypothetical protein
VQTTRKRPWDFPYLHRELIVNNELILPKYYHSFLNLNSAKGDYFLLTNVKAPFALG